MTDNDYIVMGKVTEREVYCFNCKVYSLSSVINPICSCKARLFTVVRNALTGERITGNENVNYLS